MTNEKANIIDISFEGVQKQKFRIDGDDSRIIELATTDMGIIKRFEDCEERIKSIADKFMSLKDNEDNVISTYFEVDKEMRETMDYLFDSPISNICAPSGTMFDPINGKFRYEHITDRLLALYEDKLKEETKKIQNRVNKHTSKYTKKK